MDYKEAWQYGYDSFQENINENPWHDEWYSQWWDKGWEDAKKEHDSHCMNNTDFPVH
jgi:hypothetical protein